MHSKSFPSSSSSHSHKGQLDGNLYMNQMFALIVVGILTFLGAAGMVGQMESTSFSAQSSLSVSTQPSTLN